MFFQSIRAALISTPILFTLSSMAAPIQWDLNDVSYLYPLPTRATDSNFLKAQDFIPLSWFTEVLAEADGTPFTIDQTAQNGRTHDQIRAQSIATYHSIRLLSFRIDPCFQDLHSDPCRPQIRAVWQPIDTRQNTVDGTIHTFYDFTNPEFESILKQVQDLKTKYKINTAGLPVQVHPGFQQKGFSQDLALMLKTWIKPDRISRIAFMQLFALNFRWRFLSFDVKEGKLIPIQIPLHGGTKQTFAVHRGSIPPGTLHLSEEELARSRNGEGLDTILVDYSLRIENPRLNLPGTTDCLSCHAIGGVKGASSARLGLDPIPTVADVVGLKGKFNLKNTSKNHEDAIHFRAFGYVDSEPSIADRLIIESAMVADRLNSKPE